MIQIMIGLGIMSKAERVRLARLKHFNDEMRGYDHIQATRPKTLAITAATSPRLKSPSYWLTMSESFFMPFVRLRRAARCPFAGKPF